MTEKSMEKFVMELLACPPHVKLLKNEAVEPINQCVVCLRNQRDEQGDTIMEYQADVTALSACLRDLMKAYERLRSDCTPEQLKQRPWPVAEYLAAEEALKNANN